MKSLKKQTKVTPEAENRRKAVRRCQLLPLNSWSSSETKVIYDNHDGRLSAAACGAGRCSKPLFKTSFHPEMETQGIGFAKAVHGRFHVYDLDEDDMKHYCDGYKVQALFMVYEGAVVPGSRNG